MFILCRMFVLHTALVILGDSLKVGQAIAALIANALETSFASPLRLGCLPAIWGARFFSARYKVLTKPAVQEFVFLFFFPLLFCCSIG